MKRKIQFGAAFISAVLLLAVTGCGSSKEELPPTAPQPRVRAGNRLVVAPMPPRAPGVFTRNRDTGISRAKRRITASSRAWIMKLCPAPSCCRTATAFRITSSSLSST